MILKRLTSVANKVGAKPFLRPVLQMVRDEARAVERVGRSMARKQQIERYLAATAEPKLQLGASDKPLRGWLNSDLDPLPGSIYLDATERFPLPSESLAFVFCEHFIEHLDRAGGAGCVAEVFRCLKRGGAFRVATPNLAVYIDLFASPASPASAWFMELFQRAFGLREMSPCLALNHIFYNWGHQFLYTQEELVALLRAAGFTKFEVQKPGLSHTPELRDLERHQLFYGEEMNTRETMVIEAFKP